MQRTACVCMYIFYLVVHANARLYFIRTCGTVQAAYVLVYTTYRHIKTHACGSFGRLVSSEIMMAAISARLFMYFSRLRSISISREGVLASKIVASARTWYRVGRSYGARGVNVPYRPSASGRIAIIIASCVTADTPTHTTVMSVSLHHVWTYVLFYAAATVATVPPLWLLLMLQTDPLSLQPIKPLLTPLYSTTTRWRGPNALKQSLTLWVLSNQLFWLYWVHY